MSPSEHQKFTRFAPYAVMVMIALVGGIFFTVISAQHNQDVRSRAGTTSMTVNVAATADAPVYSHSASSNYGSKNELQVENDPNDGGVDYSYIKFNLAPLAGQALTSVKLRIKTHTDSSSATSGPVSIKWVADTAWTESGITYNNKPAISSTVLGAFSPTSINSGYEVLLNAAYLQPYVGKTITLALTTTSNDAAKFNSREAYSGKPELVVTYLSTSYGATPTPTRSYYPTPTPTRSYYPTPTPTRSYYPTPTPTRSYYPTPTPTRAYAPTPTPTKYPSPTPTKYPTPTPTKYPTPTPTKYLTPTPTVYNAPTPTPTAYVTPTATPTPFVYPTPTPTNPPYPTNTPMPTPTPDPYGTSISFTLAMHGLGKGGDSVNENGTGNTSPIRSQRTIIVDVYDASNAQVTSQTGTVSYDTASGFFKGVVSLGSAVANGPYTIKVKTDQFLRTLVPGIQNLVSGQNVSLPKTAMTTGDINNDNQLNILDYNILMGCYSDLSPAVSCPAGDEVKADITDDGAVNMFDYNLFLRELTNRGGN